VVESIRYGEQSLAIARALNLRERLAYTLNDLSRGYLSTGQLDRAVSVLAEARELWQAFGNLPMLADNLGSSAEVFYLIANYDEVLVRATEGLRISQSIANVWGQGYCSWMKGYAHWEKGDTVATLSAFQTVIDLGDQEQLLFAYLPALAEIGWVHAVLGAYDHALQILKSTLPQTGSTIDWMFRPWANGYIARVQIRQGALAEAGASLIPVRGTLNLEDFSSYAPIILGLAEIELSLAQHDFVAALVKADEQLARLQKNQIKHSQAEVLYLKGAAFEGLAQVALAQTTLLAARHLAEAIGSRRVLWPVLAALGRLAEADGQAAEAEQLRQAARDSVGYIVDHCPPELRSSFVNLAAVRVVLGAA
jgi:tetratricopeptide (TPR) repeat protein